MAVFLVLWLGLGGSFGGVANKRVSHLREDERTEQGLAEMLFLTPDFPNLFACINWTFSEKGATKGLVNKDC